MDPVRRFGLWMLAKFCLLFGSLGLLNLENEELICMYIECLAISCCLQDLPTARKALKQLEPLCNRVHCSKAIKYYQKCLELAEGYNNKIIQGMLHLELGIFYNTSGQLDQAIEHGNKCLFFAKETGNERNEALAYLCMGDAYNSLSECDKAIKSFQKCLDMNITQVDNYLKMVANGGLGNANYQLCNYKEAIMFHKESLTVAQELDDKISIGRSCGLLGNDYQNIGEIDQAMDYFQQQLKIAFKTNDKYLKSLAYGNIAGVYYSRGKYDEAIEYFEKQVNLAQMMGWKEHEAAGYSNIGKSLYFINSSPKAIESHQKALEIFKQIGDEHGEESVYRSLGKIDIEMGKYDQGIKHFQKALSMAVKIKDRVGECEALACLAHSFKALGKNNEAIDYLNKSFTIAEEINVPQLQADILSQLGDAYYLVENILKAEECYKDQLKLSLEMDVPRSIVDAYANLALIRLLEDSQEAVEYLQKSLAITDNNHNARGEVKIHLLLGNCHEELQNYGEAVSCYEKALTIAKKMKSKDTETKANSYLGKLYFTLAYSTDHDLHEQTTIEDYYQKSEMYLREAIKGNEFFSHSLHDENDFKISLFKTCLGDFDVLTELLLDKKKIDEALLVCERGRGRSLNDLLISKYFISHQDVESPASQVLTYDDVQTFIGKNKLCILFYSMAHKCISWVLVQNQPISHHVLEIKREFNAKIRKIKDQSSGIEVHVQVLVDKVYAKMKLRNMRNCEDRSSDFDGNTRGHSDEDEQPGKSKNEDNAPPSNQTESKKTTTAQDNRHPLEKLFDILVAPVQSSFTEEEIVIVPQGPLYLVPFAALRNSKENCFLIDTKRIRLAPSITALKTWQECPADYHSEEGALVIGNPTVGKVILDGKEETFYPLPAAEREAEFIAERLEVTALTGCQATKEEVKKRLAKSVAVIHIAAHGNPKRGEIVLAPSQSAIQKGIPEEKDYLLTMREVHEIGIRAKLVALSYCHSGRGDIEPEGLVGMSRAFLASGARAVIASLWPVDDNATLLFMTRFYIYLRKGNSASESLQKTMKYLRNEGYKHPKYWAPFYLIGDDVKI